jgi:hypothetical protein
MLIVEWERLSQEDKVANGFHMLKNRFALEVVIR